MATTHCVIPVYGKRIRITQLGPGGEVLSSSKKLSTDGFVSVKLTAEIEEGNEILVRKASGELCVNEKKADSFKRFTLEIEFCGVNPSLLALVTNAEAYLDTAGDVAGFTVGEGEITKNFAFELWTGLSGQSDDASGYFLLPFVRAGVLGDIEVTGEDAITFSMTGASTRGGNAWGLGPYEVVKTTLGAAAKIPTAVDPYDHLLMIDTALAVPPSACSPLNVYAYTGVTAGAPGQFQPVGIPAPEDLPTLKANPDIGDDAYTGAAWTATQYVELGNGSKATWSGTAWVVFV